jgi:IS6 family transposase
VDSSGATLDFLLSARQDAAAAKRFLVKALGRANHPVPRVINTDGHSAYPPAIVRLEAEGALDENCRQRPVPYLNNVLIVAPKLFIEPGTKAPFPKLLSVSGPGL